MAGTIRRRLGIKEFAGAWLLLILAVSLFIGAGHAEDAPAAGEKRHGKMMALSIRIAKAQGNEGKVRKYKSLVRQRKTRIRSPSAD